MIHYEITLEFKGTENAPTQQILAHFDLPAYKLETLREGERHWTYQFEIRGLIEDIDQVLERFGNRIPEGASCSAWAICTHSRHWGTNEH